MSPEVLQFLDRKAWAKWLDRHHNTSSGIWVRLSKKGADIASVTYPEALEEALCYGWIDAQKRGESESTWLQRFTPRGARSIWSKINRQKALALIDTGQMKPAGLREVERAKSDGRWEQAYDGAGPRLSRRIWKQPWPRTRQPGSSSNLWTAPIATPSSGGFKPPKSPIREPAAWQNSSKCSLITKKSILSKFL